MSESTKKSILGYLVVLPSIIALIGIGLGLFFHLSSGGDQEEKITTIIGFAFSELTMIIAALAGIIYILTPDKSKTWLIVNITLFFTAGFSGILIFLLL